MKSRHIGAAVLSLALVLAGCGPPTSPTSPLTRNQLQAAGLHIVASVSRTGPATVSFRIGVENGAATAQKLVFASGQFFDIEVADGGGNVVWRWAHDKGFTQAFWDLELEAGGSYVRDAEWDLKDNSGRSVPSGTYGCRIWITNHPRDEALVYETGLTI